MAGSEHRFGYLKSRDWSKDWMIQNDPTHNWSKAFGGQSVVLLLTAGTSAGLQGVGAAGRAGQGLSLTTSGESLMLTISAKEVVPANPFMKSNRCNRGTHVIHVGGQYDSHLLLPPTIARRARPRGSSIDRPDRCGARRTRSGEARDRSGSIRLQTRCPRRAPSRSP